MSYLKERYSLPKKCCVIRSQRRRKANSICDGWICFYEIAFKLGLKLPFHRIINMVLSYFNLALGQLMSNCRRYLLGLIVLSERIRNASLQNPQAEPIPEGISLPILEVPYTHVLESEKSSPRKRQKHSSPPAPNKDKGKTPQAPKRSLGLEDNAFVRSKPDQLAQDCRYLTETVIKIDNAWKKKTTTVNNLSAMNKSPEEKARSEMICRFKAEKTSWPTLEPSEDKGGDDESNEIFSEEDEPKEENLPKDPITAPEKSPSHMRDSFIEAMERVRTEVTRPSTNAGEVLSIAQPNQGEQNS
ncbi:hypothetical protein FNV43_RR11167 [Rhamnella rubrinervis]|uniref:Uncharacterized protein n=1 Tax=Rhamnella rubrinervis TaxID=2594499 RepID=A0A8K0H5G8_9ROSA|nr:hypothetical protein FNV43_RR11167 [Rhamnella rubrinervis]